MKNIILSFATFGILGVQVINPPLANAYAAEDQSKYIERYINAINTDSLSGLKSLSHPSYLKCITPMNRDFYDDLFRKSLQRQIPTDHKVTFDKLTDLSVDKEVEGAKKRGLPYPVRPTHQMEIDYSKSEYSFVTISTASIVFSLPPNPAKSQVNSLLDKKALLTSETV